MSFFVLSTGEDSGIINPGSEATVTPKRPGGSWKLRFKDTPERPSPLARQAVIYEGKGSLGEGGLRKVIRSSEFRSSKN